EKTRVVHVDEGFTFLGFDIRRMRKRGTSKYYVYTKPSRKAIASIKDKAKAKTYRSSLHMDLDELILSLNRSLTGWANYFRHGSSKATFSAVDYFAWGRLMRWIRAKYAGKTGLSMKELRRRFCDQGWRFAWNGVELTGASSVAVTRYRYRGSTIPTPWTPTPAAADPGGWPAGKTRGAPDARRRARRVRRAGRGNGLAARPAPRPGPTQPVLCADGPTCSPNAPAWPRDSTRATRMRPPTCRPLSS